MTTYNPSALYCNPRTHYKKAETRDFLEETRNKIDHLRRMGILPSTRDGFLGKDIYSRLERRNPTRILELGYYSNRSQIETERKLEEALREKGLSEQIQSIDKLLCGNSESTQNYFLILLILDNKKGYVTASTVYNSFNEEPGILHPQQPLFSSSEVQSLLSDLSLNDIISLKMGNKEVMYYSLPS